jgi:hypothetical protein
MTLTPAERGVMELCLWLGGFFFGSGCAMLWYQLRKLWRTP